MPGDRFVVLGLARARSPWFGDVARWAMSAVIPADFVKCVSVDELTARLGSARAFSALLLDGGLPGADRDLVHRCRRSGCPVIVVDDGRGGRDWHALGAASVMQPDFDRRRLLDALTAHAVPVRDGSLLWLDRPATMAGTPVGALATVCGTGGTGASTVAIALAQGLASRYAVVLADLCRRAEQAMLHDARDVVPGVQELVEAHRGGRPSADEVRATTFNVGERGYDLLLGLRRARYWSTLRPHAFEAALRSLRDAYAAVVADVDGDFEGEATGGSIDVEERNTMTRLAARDADVVFAVGVPGLKGVHSLVRLLEELREHGVEPRRVVPVVNRALRKPATRNALVGAVGELTSTRFALPLLLPVRRVDDALRDGVALPAPLPQLLLDAFHKVVARAGAGTPAPVATPERVQPGSLGVWSPEAVL